jgi:hypothetical protein
MNAITLHTAMLRRPGLIAAAAAASALVAFGVPLAIAAPTAVPQSDSEGYVDSTARCTKPDTAVIFGTTDTSRIAICKTASGFEYRGVRVSDGAKLIVSATPLSNDSFVADSDSASYYVSPTSLKITAGGNPVRTESWTDFHSPQSGAAGTSGTSASGTGTSSAKPTTSGAKPSTPSSGTASSGTASSGTASAAPTSAAAASATPSSAPPLPPPLPAEVGGSTAPKR